MGQWQRFSREIAEHADPNSTNLTQKLALVASLNWHAPPQQLSPLFILLPGPINQEVECFKWRDFTPIEVPSQAIALPHYSMLFYKQPSQSARQRKLGAFKIAMHQRTRFFLQSH